MGPQSCAGLKRNRVSRVLEPLCGIPPAWLPRVLDVAMLIRDLYKHAAITKIPFLLLMSEPSQRQKRARLSALGAAILEGGLCSTVDAQTERYIRISTAK